MPTTFLMPIAYALDSTCFESLFEFGFIHLILDIFLRILLCANFMFEFEFVIESFTWCFPLLSFELLLLFCFVILMWKTVHALGSLCFQLTILVIRVGETSSWRWSGEWLSCESTLPRDL